MTKPMVTVFALAERARPLAERLAEAAGAQLVLPARADAIRGAFEAGETIIAIMATGALVRILAPVLVNKHDEPPVIAVSEDGGFVVPVLGGHHGANQIARHIAEALEESHAAITTASDVILGVALDEPPSGYALANPEHVKGVTSALLSGEKLYVEGDAPWLDVLSQDENATVRAIVSDKSHVTDSKTLLYHPKNHVLGLGCERGCEPEELLALAKQVIAEAGIAFKSVAAIASIDVKADEAAIHAVARHLDVEARFFDAETLELERERLQNPSDIVFAEVGCHGVAEGAALAATGADGILVVQKTKSLRATAALGKAVLPMVGQDIGRLQGRLFVVGLGPGKADWRSPEVTHMLRCATDWVGYSLYLDIADDVKTTQTRHDFPLGDEEKRVRHALELAGQGRDVALICSGDAGIYAMATLVYEVIDKGAVSDAAKRVDIQVSPGISALQAAAARSGAPLGHDFCTISLSDLLTPWEAIQKRVKAAAEGDFVIAFYNPVSKRRRTQLAYARDVLLQHRPAATPVILASSLGRPEEDVRIVQLGALQVDDVDMLTTVVVGSSDSRVLETGSGQRWVYTPRGYAAKEGTQLKEAGE